MRILVDAQLSPAIAAWINRSFEQIEAVSVRSVELVTSDDVDIYNYAKKHGYVIMSKDDDFLGLLESKGSPPQLIWITCGNTSNARMREVLSQVLEQVKGLINEGETVVEISDKPKL